MGEKGKADFPFDLNNLFNMSYSFDQLKAAIEDLANQQNVQQTLLNDLLNRDPSKETFKIIERTETIIKDGNSRDPGPNSRDATKGTAGDKSTEPSSSVANPPPLNNDDDGSVEGDKGENGSKVLQHALSDVSSMSKQATSNQRLLGQYAEQLNAIEQAIGDYEQRFRGIERKLGDHDSKHTKGT